MKKILLVLILGFSLFSENEVFAACSSGQKDYGLGCEKITPEREAELTKEADAENKAIEEREAKAAKEKYDEYKNINGDVCKYKEKIVNCIENQTNPLVISDFVCIKGAREEISAQIILDDKFKEIDKKVEDYLGNLLESKDMYFGQDKKKDYTEYVDDIYAMFDIDTGSYAKLYNEVCDTAILAETIECNGGSVNNNTAAEYINGNNLACKDLTKIKLAIYEKLAYNILKENKYQVQMDANKKFVQQQRTKYDKLINLISMNLGFLQRMLSKWPNKTKNCN